MACEKQLYLPNVISFHAKNKQKIEGPFLDKLCSFKVKGFRNIAKVPQVLYTLQKKTQSNAKIIAKPNPKTAIVSVAQSKVPPVKKDKRDRGLKVPRISKVRVSPY